MSCMKEFKKDFLVEKMTAAFMNVEYKKHRESILLDREKCMMPHTQRHVEYEIKMRKYESDFKSDEDELKRLQAEIFRKKNTVNNWRNNLMMNESESKETNAKFVHCCPAPNCKGFLSTQWKCGICETKVCKYCNSIKEDNEEHVCNEDDVKTMELLKKDTKPCPTCGSMIHKIQGCDQMWCVQCNTPFSWKSGMVVKGVIHNPHYYEWQRNNNKGIAPRIAGDIQNGCLDITYYDYTNVSHYMKEIIKDKDKCKIKCARLMRYYQLLLHINHVEMPLYRVNNEANYNFNLRQRIRYMLNELDEEKWKQELQRDEKKKIKKTDIFQIYDMFYNVGGDLFKNVTSAKNEEAIDNIIKELNKLIDYTNKCFFVLKSKYKNKMPYLYYCERYNRYNVKTQ